MSAYTAARALRPRWPRGVWQISGSIAAALCLLAALVALVAHWRAPHSGLVIGLSAAVPLLLLAAPAACVLFGLARQWLPLVVAAVVLMVAVSTQLPLYVADDAPKDGVRVVVMTSNMHLGQARAADIVRAVRDRHVDVLMVEEMTREAQTGLVGAGLERVLPHRLSKPQGAASGTGLWSRFTLARGRAIEDYSFETVVATARVPGVAVPVQLFALHVAGPWPRSQAWNRDIAKLPADLRHLASEGGPVVVGGDFNATPDVAQFRDLLDTGFRDAAEQAGAGFTPTFPAHRWYPPLITIDHVLTRNAVATSADSVTIGDTDHRALVVSVAVPPNA